MPKVRVAVPHQLDPDEIVGRAGGYIEKIIDDFQGDDVDIQWEDRTARFTFKSLGFSIKGEMAITESEIGVAVDLPFAAMIFKDKVEKALNKNLSRAVAGE